MRRALTVFGLAVATLVVAAGASSAQVPSQDSVVGSGWTSNGFQFHFDAYSGASGENPSGGVITRLPSGDDYLSGSVTCLSVEGNVALIRVQTERLGAVGFRVVDSPGGDWFDLHPAGELGVACARLDVEGPFFTVSLGDLVVTDARPSPTTKDQCKNGGWRTYGVFKNEGACVSFVAAGGKNPPANSP
jgi:hypothetical protein